MSKIFELTCPKHGHIKIEVEKPPVLGVWTVYCPWCAQRLSNKPEEVRKDMHQFNCISEGATT